VTICAERALHERCLRDEELGVPAVACATNGRVTHANAAAVELFGYDCAVGTRAEKWIAELRPRMPSGIVMPREDLPPLRALRGEAVHGVDVLVRVRGGDALLEVSARPAINCLGRPRAAIVLLADVTDQRRCEAALRRRLQSPSGARH
jgi:PAS domain-containing protein